MLLKDAPRRARWSNFRISVPRRSPESAESHSGPRWKTGHFSSFRTATPVCATESGKYVVRAEAWPLIKGRGESRIGERWKRGRRSLGSAFTDESQRRNIQGKKSDDATVAGDGGLDRPDDGRGRGSACRRQGAGGTRTNRPAGKKDEPATPPPPMRPVVIAKVDINQREGRWRRRPGSIG